MSPGAEFMLPLVIESSQTRSGVGVRLGGRFHGDAGGVWARPGGHEERFIGAEQASLATNEQPQAQTLGTDIATISFILAQISPRQRRHFIDNHLSVNEGLELARQIRANSLETKAAEDLITRQQTHYTPGSRNRHRSHPISKPSLWKN